MTGNTFQVGATTFPCHVRARFGFSKCQNVTSLSSGFHRGACSQPPACCKLHVKQGYRGYLRSCIREIKSYTVLDGEANVDKVGRESATVWASSAKVLRPQS